MNKILFPVMLMAAVIGAQAETISWQQAVQLAAERLGVQSTSMNHTFALSAKGSDNASLYVVNADQGGFAVVAGDDNIGCSPILAYSLTGKIDTANCHPSLKGWLKAWEATVEYAASGHAPRYQVTTFDSAVDPLLTTQWNQLSPYNMLCPEFDGENAPTGCPATAVGQIMKYWEWPTSGLISHSYECSTGEVLSVDFTKRNYDYSLMIDNYGKEDYTEEQAEAVAQLMADLGVAMDMNYSTKMSGCGTVDIAFALREVYGFDPALRHVGATYVDQDEWALLIKSEIDAGRPVLYDGYSTDGDGHIFITDGYNADGYFHINWGWGGICDGYFLLNALDPDIQGAGGSSSGQGFNTGQGAWIGVQPPTGESNSTPGWSLGTEQYKIEVSDDLASITVTAVSLFNIGYGDFVGKLYLCITDEETGETVFERLEDEVTEEEALACEDEDDFECEPVDLKELPDGLYQICMLAEDEDGYSEVIGQNYHRLKPVIEVKDGKYVPMALAITDVTFEPIGLWNSYVTTHYAVENCKFNVTNNSSRAYDNGFAVVVITSGEIYNLSQTYITTDNVKVLPGETVPVSVLVRLGTDDHPTSSLGIAEFGTTARGTYNAVLDIQEFTVPEGPYMELVLDEGIVETVEDGTINIYAIVRSVLTGWEEGQTAECELETEVECSLSDAEGNALEIDPVVDIYQGSTGEIGFPTFSYTDLPDGDYVATLRHLKSDSWDPEYAFVYDNAFEQPAKIQFTVKDSSGLANVATDCEAPRFYNLQGLLVNLANATPGIYIKVTNSTVSKVYIK